MKQNSPKHRSIRDEYQQHGVKNFYVKFGDEYRNPHEPKIQSVLEKCLASWDLNLEDVLDLACGSGEASLVFIKHGVNKISGVDPFTANAYQQRTGQPAESFSFEQIAAGEFSQRRYSLIICSYALHLVDPSRLPRLLYQLGLMSPALLILTPHTRPEIRSQWGWVPVEEIREPKIRARLYASVSSGE